MRLNTNGWRVKQTNATHWIKHFTLLIARAWQLKMTLRAVYANAVKRNAMK